MIHVRYHWSAITNDDYLDCIVTIIFDNMVLKDNIGIGSQNKKEAQVVWAQIPLTEYVYRLRLDSNV